MNQEVVEFKASDFAGKVKDKIKASFVDLIPEEKWDALVNAELEHVMSEYTKTLYGNSYNNDSVQAMIKVKLCEIIREKINTEVAAFVEQKYDSEKNKTIILGKIKEFVLENADKIFMRMIEGAVQSAAANISVSNNTNNY